jgi:hypothetical protein
MEDLTLCSAAFTARRSQGRMPEAARITESTEHTEHKL